MGVGSQLHDRKLDTDRFLHFYGVHGVDLKSIRLGRSIRRARDIYCFWNGTTYGVQGFYTHDDGKTVKGLVAY